MRTTMKMSRSLNGVIKNNSVVSKQVTSINNLDEAIWIGIKRYLH